MSVVRRLFCYCNRSTEDHIQRDSDSPGRVGRADTVSKSEPLRTRSKAFKDVYGRAGSQACYVTSSIDLLN